jgi:phosphoenolpyruvate carboxylase
MCDPDNNRGIIEHPPMTADVINPITHDIPQCRERFRRAFGYSRCVTQDKYQKLSREKPILQDRLPSP